MSISFELISDSEILITGTYTLFTPDLKFILKQKQALYHPDFKGWIAPLTQYNKLFDELRLTFKSIEFKAIPHFCFSILKPFNDLQSMHEISFDYSNDQKSLDNVNSDLLTKLYDYQKECIQLGIKYNGRILIADEMGVGKTVQSLALASVYRDQWPLLILCPSTLRFNWQEEVITWLKIKKSEIQIVQKSKDAIRTNVKILIISYDLSSKFQNQLAKFKIAIADEAHYLKNGQAQRSQVCNPILRKCRYVFLLTGTPALSKPKDIFNILNIIRPDVFCNFKEFGFRYCDPRLSKFGSGFDFNGAAHLKELHFILKNFIMIRRLKKDVLLQLPEKRRIKIQIKLQTDPKIQKQIQGLLASLDQSQIDCSLQSLGIDFQNKDGDDQNGQNIITKCYQLTGRAKIKAIKEYIETLIENQIKFIFFAHHMEMLDEIQNHCDQLKIKSVRIDGKISFEQRHINVQIFQTKEDIRVAILGITAASVGLTLTAASTIVFGEMHWTPAVMLQAEDRAHRIGQQCNVDCQYLIGIDTLDDILYQKLEKKMGTVSNIVDGVQKKFNALEVQQISDTNEDIEERVKDLNENEDNLSMKKGSDEISQTDSLAKFLEKEKENLDTSRVNCDMSMEVESLNISFIMKEDEQEEKKANKEKEEVTEQKEEYNISDDVFKEIYEIHNNYQQEKIMERERESKKNQSSEQKGEQNIRQLSLKEKLKLKLMGPPLCGRLSIKGDLEAPYNNLEKKTKAELEKEQKDVKHGKKKIQFKNLYENSKNKVNQIKRKKRLSQN